MDKNIQIKFTLENFQESGNIFKFSGIASRAGVMTSHAIIFAENAFKSALKGLKKDKKMLPILFNHDQDQLLGGFPVNQIKEKGADLEVNGELNLEVERARDIAALMKQGVVDSMSVSISINPEAVTFDDKLNALIVGQVQKLWEITLCTDGSNPEARITSFLALKDDLTTVRECETFLRTEGFTQNQAKQFISVIKSSTREVVEEINESAIRDVLLTLNKSNNLTEVANVIRSGT